MRSSWRKIKGVANPPPPPFAPTPKKKRRDVEGPIHIAVYNWLSVFFLGLCYHCPNGLDAGNEVIFIRGRPVPRAAIAWKKLEKKGARSGVLDLTLHWVDSAGYPRTGYWEIKSDEGSLELTQKEFMSDLDRVKIPHAVIRSLDDARETARLWGLPLRYREA